MLFRHVIFQIYLPGVFSCRKFFFNSTDTYRPKLFNQTPPPLVEGRTSWLDFDNVGVMLQGYLREIIKWIFNVIMWYAWDKSRVETYLEKIINCKIEITIFVLVGKYQGKYFFCARIFCLMRWNEYEMET